jgi:hypothetical protein
MAIDGRNIRLEMRPPKASRPASALAEGLGRGRYGDSGFESGGRQPNRDQDAPIVCVADDLRFRAG